MKKSIIGIHMLIALLFSMCTSPKQKGKGLPVFNVADALTANLPDTFTWNSIAKNIRMIPLKTDGVIGSNPSVKYFSEDLIIVTEYHSGVFVFDGEGQEIVSFDHKGMGPKEYLYITRVNYSQKDSLILLYDGGLGKLFRFDLKGNYVDSKSLETNGTVLSIDSDGTMIAINQEGKSLISVWDANLQLIGDYLPFDTLYNDKQKLSCWLMAGKPIGGDTFNVLPVCGDTVYTITKGGTIPLCVVDRGNYKCSSDDLNNRFKVQDNAGYLKTEDITSFSNYFMYGTETQKVLQLWNMKTEELLAWHKGERVGPNHELVFGFRYVFPSGHEIRKWSFDYLNQNCGVFIRQADECLDDVPGLTADDNPVLIVLEF